MLVKMSQRKEAMRDLLECSWRPDLKVITLKESCSCVLLMLHALGKQLARVPHSKDECVYTGINRKLPSHAVKEGNKCCSLAYVK